MSKLPFVHLRVHSDYSILSAVPSVSDIVSTAKQLEFDRIALTDAGVMFGAIEFQTLAKKNGITPIHGIELQLEKERNEYKPSVLVFPTQQSGYKSLCRLIASHYLPASSTPPTVVKREQLFSSADHLIALSGFHDSEFGTVLMRRDRRTAERLASEWKEVFGDRFYLEVHDFGREVDEFLSSEFEWLSNQLDIPIVATNHVQYLKSSDAETLDLMRAISEKMTVAEFRATQGVDHTEAYLKSAEEMYERFAGREEMLERTVEIAERASFKVPTGTVEMPVFPVPADSGTADVDEYFVKLARDGLRNRLGREIPDEYRERLDYELDVVRRTGFAGYFLIVCDFIAEARKRGVPVGPGRGSVAGSLAAYALHITQLDPIEHDLIFERFLNPERISAPDMDIDFADDTRSVVIDYVRERYGDNAVSQIATFGRMKEKGAIRDAGRVLGLVQADIEKFVTTFSKAKQTIDNDKLTISDVVEKDADLQKLMSDKPEYQRLIDAAERLEGHIRNVGTHAAGIVIAPGDLAEYLPLYRIPGGELISQYDKDVIEKAGLLKMDMLGLTMLTTIRETVKSIVRNPENRDKLNEHGEFDIDAIPVDDQRTLDLFGKGWTTGVFQFESTGMVRSLIQLKPTRLGDLIAMNALYRPGPMQRIPDFINCKQGKQQIKYLHPLLEPILKDTYGVIVYQEQVMLIAREVGGFSMSKADTLRKAMGKKDAALLETLHPEFIEGAKKNGLSKSQADELYDQILKFSNYGFNKSHSAGYSYLAYQTGYLKAHFAKEFLAASLTANMSRPERVIRLINEARRMDIPMLAPDVNYSMMYFDPTKGGIRFGLVAIKNVGEGAARDVIRKREEGGHFTSLFDFAGRLDLKSCNKKVLESLVNAGACDSFGERGRLLASIEDAIEYASRLDRMRNSKSASLFGEGSVAMPQPTLRAAEPVPVRQKIELEKKLTGYYITGHPLDDFALEIEKLTSTKLSEYDEWNGKKVKIAGVLTSISRRTTRSGKIMAIGRLEDYTGEAELVIWDELFTRHRDLLEAHSLLLVEGRGEHKEEDDVSKIIVDAVYNLESVLQQKKGKLILTLTPDRLTPEWMERFLRVIEDSETGPVNVQISIVTPSETLHTWSRKRSIKIDRNSFKRFEKLVGADRVQWITENGS